MATKVILTDEELNVLNDKNFLLSKRRVTEKISLLLSDVDKEIEMLKQHYANVIPAEAFAIHSKISRGENYLGLPFMILDNPRIFIGNDVFVFRTMFWWGNFISFTFQCSGKFYQKLKPIIPTLLMQLKKRQVYVCINPDAWQHHFEKNNYVLLDDYCTDEASINKILQLNFLKLAVKISVNDYDNTNEVGIGFYRLLLEKMENLT